ncbi:hypothetical protein Nepgr_033876 [Nepenthes gracilis]|uniref:Uncharacterized protein n=1 Tax=Nepenthes gracilis TaxID=150966 RepID=A0AAD3TM80_NEPGR|nr:hypothetical protein Nepgr_033876 [Nepenthes gracilis]
MARQHLRLVKNSSSKTTEAEAPQHHKTAVQQFSRSAPSSEYVVKLNRAGTQTRLPCAKESGNPSIADVWQLLPICLLVLLCNFSTRAALGDNLSLANPIGRSSLALAFCGWPVLMVDLIQLMPDSFCLAAETNYEFGCCSSISCSWHLECHLLHDAAPSVFDGNRQLHFIAVAEELIAAGVRLLALWANCFVLSNGLKIYAAWLRMANVCGCIGFPGDGVKRCLSVRLSQCGLWRRHHPGAEPGATGPSPAAIQYFPGVSTISTSVAEADVKSNSPPHPAETELNAKYQPQQIFRAVLPPLLTRQELPNSSAGQLHSIIASSMHHQTSSSSRLLNWPQEDISFCISTVTASQKAA